MVFKSSMCYNSQRLANVMLRCPQGYVIRTASAFTGVSRENACSYTPWDCIIQDGATYRCDGQRACTVTVTTQNKDDELPKCGSNGKTTYFQIEYECHTGKLSKNNFKIKGIHMCSVMRFYEFKYPTIQVNQLFENNLKI